LTLSTCLKLSERVRSERCALDAAFPETEKKPTRFERQVMQVRKKDTSRIYALKTIRKAHIVSRSEVTHTLAERTVLAQVNNPFIVPLKFSFQSAEKLYLVLAFVNGGELFHHLQREGRFSEQRSRFYAAELLCALEHLHQFNVIYRDLKPENILIDYVRTHAILFRIFADDDDDTGWAHRIV
jgi:serine/threonine protein kinase